MDLNNKHIHNGHQDTPELSQEKNFLGKWAAFFIARFRVVFLIIIAILIWGSYQYTTLQREAQPKVVLPMAIVSTAYIGASPDEVETLITDIIEDKLEELDDISDMTSTSSFSVSSIFLEFTSGTDVDEKIRDIREKLSNIDGELPEEAEAPVVSDLKTGESPTLIFALSGDQDILTLQNIAKNVKREIEQIKGVSEVGIVGDTEREIRIIVEPQKLHTYKISLEDIKTAIAQSNVNFPGGEVELNNQIYSIRTVGRFDQISELHDVIIKSTDNGQVYLGDIAEINDGFKDREMYISKFGTTRGDHKLIKDAIIIAVKRNEAADVTKVKNDVMKMLESKQRELIPSTVQLTVVSDMSEYVEDILGSTTNSAIGGLLLVIVVLFIFIGFRESLIVSTVIPLSILLAFGLMKLSGQTLNNITMFSMILAVGMLVDNAIVIMENVGRLRHKGLTAKQAAEVGTNQIAPAVFAATLTTLASFFPIALTSGVMGDFIKPIPLTVIFALSASFVMAITVTPSVCAMLLSKYENDGNNKEGLVTRKIRILLAVLLVFILSMFAFSDFDQQGLERFGALSWVGGLLFSLGIFVRMVRSKSTYEHGFVIRKYAAVLRWILNKRLRKLTVICLVIVALMYSIGLIPAGLLKVEMFGASDYPYLFVNVNTPPGATLEETKDIVTQVERRIFDVPEIETFVSYTGSNGVSIWSDLMFDSGGIPNEATIQIYLLDEKDRQRKSMEIAEALRGSLEDIPGAEIAVVELEDGPPSAAPIYIRVIGNNMENIEKVADDFASILSSINGVRDVETSNKRGKNILQVEVDKQKAKRFGLDNLSVALSIRNAINGLEATTFRQNQEEIDVIIKTSEYSLSTINDLENIFFYNYLGEAVPFSQVASFVETDSVQSIHHEDGKRLISVVGSIEAGINPQIETPLDAENIFKEKIRDYVLPKDITVEYGGESEMMGDSFGDMMINMIIAVILVFIVLSIKFNSLSQPFIILFAVPMALIGVMNGLLVTGNTFGFVAFVGVVALVGITVNDGIVLVDYINYLREHGHDMDEAITQTGMTRFIPVLATTITTAGGILPITLREPFLAPMGIALIAGLCVSTVLILVVVPVTYSISEGFKLKRKQKKAKENSAQVNV